jgi:hypothetical protein
MISRTARRAQGRGPSPQAQPIEAPLEVLESLDNQWRPIEAMLSEEMSSSCAARRYERHGSRAAHRWGVTMSEIDYHGSKAAVRRPRVRKRRGAELELTSWRAIKDADLLSRWAFNQMLIGVATRKYARSVRLPDGDLAGQAKRATTKSSVSRASWPLSRAVRDTFGRFALIQRNGNVPSAVPWFTSLNAIFFVMASISSLLVCDSQPQA